MVAPGPVRKVYWAVQIGFCLLLGIVVLVLSIRGGGGPGGYVLAVLCLAAAAFVIVLWRRGKL
jgi:hypothetical protein